MATVELAPAFQFPHQKNHRCPSYRHTSNKFVLIIMHQRAKHTSARPAASITYTPVQEPTRKPKLLLQGNTMNADVDTLYTDGEAKDSLNNMEERNSPFDSNTYISLLQTCERMQTLEQGKQIHAQVLLTGLEQNVSVGTKLVSMYSVLGSVSDARLVFDKILNRNLSLWNAMLRGYDSNGQCEETIALYHQMPEAIIQPDNFTFTCVLNACIGISALEQGKEVHDHIIRSGLESDIFVGNALITMYAKFGYTGSARQLFDKMSRRNLVSWNALISGYAQNGEPYQALELFHGMQVASLKANAVTVASVLPAYADIAALQLGKGIHAYIIRSGFESNIFVGNALVSMYAKCGSMEDGWQAFDRMPKRNAVSWNAMIAGCARNGHGAQALKLFRQMQLAGINIGANTMASVIPACAPSEALQQGKEIHAYIIRRGFESDVFVGSALIDMYARCATIQVARQVFDKMSKRNVVSWNSMIAGYGQNGHSDEALKLFNKMQIEHVQLNAITIMTVLSACGHLVALQWGKEIHDYIIRNGFESNVCVENALITMYAKCWRVDLARQVFDGMSQRSVASWNAMISGYSQNGHATEALKICHQMHLSSLKANLATIASVIPACVHIVALQQSKEIHAYIIRSGFESDVCVGSALIDMYNKCGSLENASWVFNQIEKTVASWNMMIAGYGMHGQGENALELFNRMHQSGIKPDHITFVAVLSACSHAGLVDKGWQYFNCMTQEYGVTPRMEHYACMVDLLGRAGCLDEAHEFIKKMPIKPDANVWGTLLGACRNHCNTELGEHVGERVIELEPDNDVNYVLLSNIYAAAGRWDGVAKVRKLMKDKGLKKRPGCSWIVVKNMVHAFLAGDKSHPQSEKIYAMLESLAGKMKEAGYVPDMNFVTKNAEKEEKEYILCSHSERLALAFGLINTCPGIPLQITKNLRVCGDCHTATKFISKIVRRTIMVRDANRFHHFKDGLCSCGDYW